MTRLAFSAFCLVMDDICSSEEEISSMDAACSEAPSANFWLADDAAEVPDSAIPHRHHVIAVARMTTLKADTLELHTTSLAP
jgi:hypothetical protein